MLNCANGQLRIERGCVCVCVSVCGYKYSECVCVRAQVGCCLMTNRHCLMTSQYSQSFILPCCSARDPQTQSRSASSASIFHLYRVPRIRIRSVSGTTSCRENCNTRHSETSINRERQLLLVNWPQCGGHCHGNGITIIIHLMFSVLG